MAIFNSVVLSGASTKIPLHIGFMKALYERGDLYKRSFYGNSAGAIIAAAMASGMTVEEITGWINKVNFSSFARMSVAELVLSIFKKDLYETDAFSILLKDVFGDKKLKDIEADYLGVIGHSLEDKTWRQFNSVDDPEMYIWQAVRISSGIPMLFKPIKYQGKHWVDGGISKDLPVDTVRHSPYIAHLVDSSEDVEVETLNKIQLGVHVIGQLFEANREESIRDNPNGIILRTKYQKNMLDFDLSQEEKAGMINIAYNNVKEELSKIGV